MVKVKDNSKITITRDQEKSYVYIEDNGKDVGYLAWDYKKKKWKFYYL